MSQNDIWTDHYEDRQVLSSKGTRLPSSFNLTVFVIIVHIAISNADLSVSRLSGDCGACEDKAPVSSSAVDIDG